MKVDGGPAFPEWSDKAEAYVDKQIRGGGMTLRDYFAGQALIGLLAHEAAFESPGKTAQWAYQQADIMLMERAK